VKSNPSREVIATLAEAGLSHWDVPRCMKWRPSAPVQPKAHFHYHNPVKSRREIADAYSIYGCRRFVVDCPRGSG
jgi:ornithine decarboxylase